MNCFIKINDFCNYTVRILYKKLCKMHATPCYLNYREDHNADIIMQEILIKDSIPCTFYSLLNWNSGKNEIFSGYAGFQCLCDKSKTVHFSIWNPEANHSDFKTIYKIANCNEELFTGEGEGKKYIFKFNYIDNHWYRLKVVLDISGNFTIVSFELVDLASRCTYEICTVQYPKSKAVFRHSYGSFIEDFNNTKDIERSFFLEMDIQEKFIQTIGGVGIVRSFPLMIKWIEMSMEE